MTDKYLVVVEIAHMDGDIGAKAQAVEVDLRARSEWYTGH
jgi:hypothetical protein